MKAGFKAAIFFVQRLREFAYLQDRIIILSIDPETLSSVELSLLKKEIKEIEPRFLSRLPEDLLEILRFVYNQNNLGIKPNFSNIRRELGTSKPTTSKRINKLANIGHMIISKKGRGKVLELTQKGFRLFSNSS